jgi:hypothetical protein
MGEDAPMPTAFATDLIRQLESAAPRLAWPRIAALHLPQAASFGTKDGEFCAVELEGGALGLSYVLLDDTLQRLLAEPAQSIVGRPALDVARWYAEATGTRRTLGFAAANAMARHLFDQAGWQPGDAADSIGGLAPQAGEHVGMVGFFPPLVKPVTAAGARLTVLELRAELAGTHEGFEVTLDATALRDCDKVLSTSTVLLNDTLDAVLAQCARARAFVMIGPGAGGLPDGLFARGVTALGGTWITDAAGFKAALASGEPWGRFARKSLIRAADYPGLPALLAQRGHGAP